MVETTRQLILEWICLAGEIPVSSLHLLGLDKKTYQQALYRLKAGKYVITSGSKDTKTIRLQARVSKAGDLPKTFGYIRDNLGPAYLDNYLHVSSNHKFNGSMEWKKRTMRVSEIIQLCKKAGVVVEPWKTEKLSMDNKRKNIGEVPQYFSSIQIRDARKIERSKTVFTRYCGLLMSPGGAYVIYHMDKGLAAWSASGEATTITSIQYLLAQNWNLPNHLKPDEATAIKNCTPDAIYVTRDDETTINILNAVPPSSDRIKKRRSLDTLTSYQKTCCAPLDTNGSFQIWMMTQMDYQERLKQSFIAADYMYSRNYHYDGFYDEKTKIVLWFDGNLRRLRHMQEMMAETVIDKNANKVPRQPEDILHFIIFCFDWQLPLLQTYLERPFTSKTFRNDDIAELLQTDN